MDIKKENKLHWSFWLISIIALIWNFMGAINFIVQMNPEMISAYRTSEQAIILTRPLWATIGFFLAVFAGSFGATLLLFKQSKAYYLFITSFIGVVVTMVHSLNIDMNFGTGEIIGIIVLPILIAGFMIWYTRLVAKKNWIS